VTFYFRHGQRGGNAGKGAPSSKIRAVVGMAKRKLLYRTGGEKEVYAALEARKVRAADLLVPRIQYMLKRKKEWYPVQRREMAAEDADAGGGRAGWRRAPK